MKRYNLIDGIQGEIYRSDSDVETNWGRFYWGDVLETLEKLTPEYEGKVQLIYIDPPFLTGQEFKYRQPVGTEGWQGNRDKTILHTAYIDRYTRNEFYDMIEKVLSYAHSLLAEEGCIYVHVDYRTSAYIKIILDNIFGAGNFLNEIIWHYRSGGRARGHFSRKHDNILFYRKTEDYYFNIDAIGIPRGTDKRNNMKKNIDDRGRIYWSIKSAGKEYRYYADDKIYPSDVWDDIPHLHQRNPERTGYDTQKPEALLERIVLASSRPGDIVMDFFAGSGTTLNVAQRHSRHWIGVDSSIFSLHTCRRRLLNEKNFKEIGFVYSQAISPIYREDISPKNIATGQLTQNVDHIDSLGIGYIEDNIYNSIGYRFRSLKNPDLELDALYKGFRDRDIEGNILSTYTIDVQGRQRFYIDKKRKH